MNYSMPGGFDTFDAMYVIFPIFFLLVLGIIVVGAVKGISQWNKNNNSPKLTVEATVVSKRQEISTHSTADTSHGSHHSTYYYITFQVESGDRMELAVSTQEYGLLAEGDHGKLSFQGTRYLEFHRV